MDKNPEEKIDPTRRQMVFAALAAAFTPGTTAKTLGLSSPENSLAVATDIAATPAYKILTNFIKNMESIADFNDLRISVKMDAAEILKYHPELATPELAIKLEADAIVDSVFTKPIMMNTSNRFGGYLRMPDLNVLQQSPNREAIRAVLQKFSSDKNYQFVFGGQSVEEATDNLTEAIKSGSEGMNKFFADYQANHKRIAKEVIAKTIERVEAEFSKSTMASAHMMGGYPIPANYPAEERERVKIGNRGRSGEWSERIQPPEEGKAFPLSR